MAVVASWHLNATSKSHAATLRLTNHKDDDRESWIQKTFTLDEMIEFAAFALALGTVMGAPREELVGRLRERLADIGAEVIEAALEAIGETDAG